jgi:hypothetical protein
MIPTVTDLQSAPMAHRYGDLYALPGLTNFLGCVQMDLDLTGLRSLNFPPFATSDVNSGNLYLDGRLFNALGATVTFTWRPDRVVREAEHDGLFLRSTTALALGRMAAVVLLEVENRSGSEREVALRFGVQGSVTQAREPWGKPLPPREADHEIALDEGRGAVRFRAKQSEAVQIQGTYPRARRPPPGRARPHAPPRPRRDRRRPLRPRPRRDGRRGGGDVRRARPRRPGRARARPRRLGRRARRRLHAGQRPLLRSPPRAPH